MARCSIIRTQHGTVKRLPACSQPHTTRQDISKTRLPSRDWRLLPCFGPCLCAASSGGGLDASTCEPIGQRCQPCRVTLIIKDACHDIGGTSNQASWQPVCLMSAMGASESVKPFGLHASPSSRQRRPVRRDLINSGDVSRHRQSVGKWAFGYAVHHRMLVWLYGFKGHS